MRTPKPAVKPLSPSPQRPSSRPDIMNLYMPPHIFRLTNFRVSPKVEIGPDGKPRLMYVVSLLQFSLLIVQVVFSSEAEDHEPVDCKVEDNGYNMPASLSWSSQASPTSPVDNPFHGNSLYPFSSSQGHGGGSNGHGRTSGGSDRWSAQGDSLLSPLHPQDMSWSPPSSTLSSSHSMGRRGLLQSENWPSIHSQSNRWKGQQQESSSATANGFSSLNSALVVVCPYQLLFYYLQHVPTFYKSGLLVSTSIALLMSFKTPDNLSASAKSSRILVALDVVGFASAFLNISACISCFILLNRPGETPHHAARDSNAPLGGKISVPQHRMRWVVWHCEFQAFCPIIVPN